MEGGGRGGCLPDYIGAAHYRGGLGEYLLEGYFLICGPVEDFGNGGMGELGSGRDELDVWNMFLEGCDDAGVDISIFIVDYCIMLVHYLLATIYSFGGSLSGVFAFALGIEMYL